MAAFTLHRAHQGRQQIGSLLRADAADQGQTAGLVIRIKNVHEAQQLIRLLGRAGLQPERILDAAAILDMGMIRLAGAIADPHHMA